MCIIPEIKAPEMPGEQDALVSRVEYVPVATEDPHKEHHARRQKQVEQGNWGVWFVDSLIVQNVIGLVIIANGAIIGLETDFPTYWDGRKGSWDMMEKGFLVFFVCELILKVCIEGVQFCNPGHPDFLWNIFDLTVIGVGVGDAVMEYLGRVNSTVGFATLFRMFRLLRILRLFRLLRYLTRLYALAMGLVEACQAIFWVTILMCFALYVCGIVLVKTVGQSVTSTDPHYDFLHERFGSVLKSMLTLFVLISSPNLPYYQDEDGLLEGRPIFTAFLIFFITFGCFGLLGMLTGVINETMFENNQLRKQEKRVRHEEMRKAFGTSCSDLFEDLPKDDAGEAPISEIKFLAPQLLELLEGAGAHIAHGDILKLIDNIDMDESGTINIWEFVEAMETVVEGLNPLGVLMIERRVAHVTRTLTTVKGDLAKVEDKLLIELRQLHQTLRDEHSTGQLSIEAKVAQCMDSRMQKLFDRLDGQDSGVRRGLEQIGGVAQSMQNDLTKLSTQMDGSHNYVQAVVNQQTIDVRRTMDTLLRQKESGGESLRNVVSQQICETLKKMQNEEGEIGRSMVKLSDKMGSTVSKQIVEMGTSLQQLWDQKQVDAESRLSALSEQMAGLQKQFVLGGMQQQKEGGRPGVTTEQMEGTEQAVQKLLQQWRAIGNEASLNGVVSRHAEQIHKSIQKFLDQKDSSESRLQLAVSSQIQDIATAVQKLLHERDCRAETSREGSDTVQQAACQERADVQNSAGLADGSLEAVVFKQVQDMLLSVQRQIDATHSNLLEGVTELGGVVVAGVADLLAKNKMAIQQECANMLQDSNESQERMLRGLLDSSPQQQPT